MKKNQHPETEAIRAQMQRTQYREHSSPIFMTSSFVFEDAEQARALFADEQDGNIYTRFSNPNHDELIKKLCILEHTEDGMALASGMAAMFCSMAAFLSAGDHLLASRSLFGSTHQIITKIFPRWGISHTYVDIDKPEEFEKNIRPNTKMIFVETPSNPSMDLIDIELLAALAQKHNLLLNVDNCFATPHVQNPALMGAHLVTHSATKFLDGQGRVIAGVVLGSKELIKEVRYFARHTGPALSPFNSWTLSKSLETFSLRMERHSENALELAQFIDKQTADVLNVKYPHLPSHPQYALAKRQMRTGGGLVTFELKGGLERAQRFLSHVEMMSFTANLGDTRSIVAHPASTTHSKLTEAERRAVGIENGTIRVSVGLEHISDILADIEKALSKSR